LRSKDFALASAFVARSASSFCCFSALDVFSAAALEADSYLPVDSLVLRSAAAFLLAFSAAALDVFSAAALEADSYLPADSLVLAADSLALRSAAAAAAFSAISA
jgi:hypothetical protein